MVRVKKLFQRSRMNLLDKHFSSCHSCCQMVKKGWVRYSFDSFLILIALVYQAVMVKIKNFSKVLGIYLLDKHFRSCHSFCQIVKKGWVRCDFDSDLLNTFCRVYNRLDWICDVFQTNRDDAPDDVDVCELPYANDPYGWRNAYARQSCPHCYRLSRSLGYQTAHQLLLWAAQLSQWYFHLL